MIKKILIALLLINGNAGAQTMELVKDINPAGGADPYNFLAYNNKVYFDAFDGSNRDLWYTDGTAAGTQKLDLSGLITPTPYMFSPRPMAVLNSKLLLYYAASSHSVLMTSDGTTAGTQVIKNLEYLYGTSAIHNNNLYFFADDSLHGEELWRSDGTVAGTYMVKDIFPGINSSIADRYIIEYGNGVVFQAADSMANNTYNYELWFSDGTAAGTYRIKDLTGDIKGSQPSNFYVYNGKLYFAAGQGYNAYDVEPWVTDGTDTGTHKLKDINTATDGSSYPQNFLSCNGKLVFFARPTSNTNRQLFVTDGTNAGTNAIALFNSMTDPVCYNSNTYFLASDTLLHSGLWTSNNTTPGTRLLKHINTGTSGYPVMAGVLNNAMVFFADDGSNGGLELWISDGTESGTYKPAFSNAVGYAPISQYGANYYFLNNALYLTAQYNNTGAELWKFTMQPAGIAPTATEKNVLTLYPNPAADQLQINATKPCNIQLLNPVGQIIYERAIVNTETIDLSALSVGIYYIINKATGEVKKFVKQ